MEQPAWKVILLHIVGGIIVNNLLTVAVNVGLPQVEGDIPFQTTAVQTTLLAMSAGGVGGLVLSLSLMLYFPQITIRSAAFITALWAALLGILWTVVVVWGLSNPLDSPQGGVAAVVMVMLPPMLVVTGWAVTSRAVNGYLTSLEGRLMAGVVVTFSLLNFLTVGGVFSLFSDHGSATLTGVVFGGIMGVVMARMMPETS